MSIDIGNGNEDGEFDPRAHAANRMFNDYQASNSAKKMDLQFIKDQPYQVCYCIKLRNLQKNKSYLKLSNEEQEHLK